MYCLCNTLRILVCFVSMKRCMTSFLNASITVGIFNHLTLLLSIVFFLLLWKYTKYETFQSPPIQITKSIFAHYCYVLLKYLRIKSKYFFFGKMYANPYRKTKKIWKIQYVDYAENRTKWAEMILIMRKEIFD